ncbi:MAG: DUF5309 domain-containing protein [Proteobacteria bacterium]|nr:DUF5309 domain-containing protein [Pseudomonadota bacterium]
MRIKSRAITRPIIYRISPTQTPFMSSIPKVKASAVYHEWQTQDLAAAANNAQIEGDDASAVAATPTARLGNYSQISTKTVIVAGTQMAVKAAGRNDELAYQLSLKSLEIKRDMETALTQNNVTAVGNSTTARQLRGLRGWLATNRDMGAGGAAPVYTANPGTAPTNGTQRAFTESQVKNVLQLSYIQGGEPDTIMVGPANKQVFSTFSGNATRMDKAEDGKVYASTSVYVSDFGEISVTPNRFQLARDAFVLQIDKFAMAVLRPFQTVELAKTGDAEKRELIVEYTLEARQEKASGVVSDLL